MIKLAITTWIIEHALNVVFSNVSLAFSKPIELIGSTSIINYYYNTCGRLVDKNGNLIPVPKEMVHAHIRYLTIARMQGLDHEDTQYFAMKVRKICDLYNAKIDVYGFIDND